MKVIFHEDFYQVYTSDPALDFSKASDLGENAGQALEKF